VIKSLSVTEYNDKYEDLFSKKFNAKGEEIKEDDDADDKLYSDFKDQLDKLTLPQELNVVSFEKDDDTNHHIAWIH